MHRVQKPLVSSSFLSTVSSLHFHFLSFQSSSQQHINSPYLHSLSTFSYFCFPLSPLIFLDFPYLLQTFLPFHAFCHPSPFTSHTSNILPPPCTCSHLYSIHWCHLSASSETQHIKISISLARTFRPSWIIHTHISAPHFLTPREVLLFSTPSNEIWMAFFILPGMIVSLRWV